MRLTFIKRLLIGLSVVGLIGGPWAQALTQSATHQCTMSVTAAVADVAAVDEAPCDMAAHKVDPGKNTLADCAQNCVASLNLVMPTVSLCFERLARVIEPIVPVDMDGRTLEPELSPPIALV